MLKADVWIRVDYESKKTLLNFALEVEERQIFHYLPEMKVKGNPFLQIQAVDSHKSKKKKLKFWFSNLGFISVKYG